jgi:hypothetical protein
MLEIEQFVVQRLPLFAFVFGEIEHVVEVSCSLEETCCADDHINRGIGKFFWF